MTTTSRTMKIYKYKYSLWGFLSSMFLTVMFAIAANEPSHWIMVFIFLTLSITALTYKNGIEITQDFKFRTFFTVLGKSFGDWENLHELQYLSVIRVKQSKYRITGGFVDQELLIRQFIK